MDRLETTRLIVRPFSMDDLEEAHRILDQDVQWAGPGVGLEQRRATVQFYIRLANWRDTGCLFGYRAITQRESGQLIGICGLTPVLWSPARKALFWPQLYGAAADPADMACATLELEVGYALASTCRGQGYATEAAAALIAHAFEQLHARRLFSCTSRDNTDSANVMRRLRMRLASHPDWREGEWPYWVGMIDSSQIAKGDEQTR